MSMTLEVPDDIQRALRVPEPERQTGLLVELACALWGGDKRNALKAVSGMSISMCMVGR